MKRLLRILLRQKKYCILIPVLTAIEAALCLTVPFLIGDAVGTGLQGKGYPDSFPLGMSQDAFVLFRTVLPSPEREEFAALYAPEGDAPDSLPARYRTDRPCRRLREDADRARAQALYENTAACALILARGSVDPERTDYDALADKISLKAVKIYVSRLALTEEDRRACYDEASACGALLKRQVAALLLPYVYEDAGMDLDGAQAAYLRACEGKMIACALAQLLCAVGAGLLVARVSTHAESALRAALRDKFFSGAGSSGVPAEQLRDADQAGVALIGSSLNYAVHPLLYSLSVVLIGGGLTLRRYPALALLILLCAAAITACVYASYRLSYRKYYRMQESYLAYSGIMESQLRQTLSVRAGNAQGFAAGRVAALSGQIRKDERFVLRAICFAVGGAGLMINLLTAAVVLWSGRTMLETGLPVGDIVACLQIAVMIVTAVMTVGAAVIFAPKALVALRAVTDLLDAPEKDVPHGGEPVPPRVESLVFDRVRLFPGAPEVSFTAKPGALTVISGPAGCGKSTLLQAVLRRHPLHEGEIRVNGADLAGLDESYPAALVSYAPTSPALFSATVRENVRLYGGDPARAGGALAAAACDFLGPAETAQEVFLANAGERFSGGQRSRLSLACALSKPAGIYLLDDCLSSLDQHTRRRILDGLTAAAPQAVFLLATQTPEAMPQASQIIRMAGKEGD